MSLNSFLLLAALLPTVLCFGAEEPKRTALQRNEYIEEGTKRRGADNTFYEQLKKSRIQADKDQLEQSSLIQGSRAIYTVFNNRVKVPGFISAAPLPQMARIVGPVTMQRLLRMGDTLYVRWSGAPMPKVGDRFATFAPGIVTQNLLNPSEFQVIQPLESLEKLPTDTRLAGYFYESSGRVRVIRIKGGLVEVTVDQISSQISVGDELMIDLPKLDNISPITSGIQLSAAVVCGSPVDRLSTTKRSFIYINRGSRDGIRVGRIFESLEAVQLDQAVGGAAPQLSNGEAIVVHTTDSYSTAMITKQFDVIRIGSLLRTKQESNPISPVSPFEGFQDLPAEKAQNKIPEIPNLDNLPGGADNTLPEPRRKPDPSLSELDALERSLRAKELSADEKARLNTLSRQEKMKATALEEVEEETGTPGTPALENSFKDTKKSAKKEKKTKKKSKNDEEELNQLMMEN